jgi:TonB-dependent SusC/RagA subfamily outer membrane receptor
MKKLLFFLLMSVHVWAQQAETTRILDQYFSSPNQRVLITNDTLKVFWYESANKQNPTEFRDTSMIALNQIAQVKVIKGRNAQGQRGIGLQIYPTAIPEANSKINQDRIGKEKLDQTNAASLQQKLQGQAAGVQVGNDNSPGGNAMVRIHGIGSINANSPLYVVDGVPLQGNINSINPNDVESVQVLKDPAQTALYGVRGANGVILITTLQHRETTINLPPVSILPLTIWSWGINRKALLDSGQLNGLVQYLSQAKNK